MATPKKLLHIIPPVWYYMCMVKAIHKETLAYTAGLIDGEGYISLLPSTTSTCSYVPIVKVASCDGIMAPFLQQKYGGHISSRTSKQTNARNSQCWALTGSERVKDFLVSIRPYLKVKKANADNVISYIDNCKLKKTYDKASNTYTIFPELLELRIIHYKKAKSLNHRGLALAETE
jgi:hypothetical protein